MRTDLFETVASDELVDYAVDVQDNDLDRDWSRHTVCESKAEAERLARGLLLLGEVNQAVVQAIPRIRFARIGG